MAQGLGFTWTDKFGGMLHFQSADVNGRSRMEWASDRYGNGIEISYGSSGHIETVSDLVTPSRWIEFEYTGDTITSITDFTERTWIFTYNTNGRLQSVAAPENEDTPLAVVEYEYFINDTLDGLLKKVTNTNGRATQFTYYPNRWGFEERFVNGDVQSISYDVHRGRTAFIDERGFVNYYAYNDVGNPTEELRPDRTTTANVWDNSLKQSVTDRLGNEVYEHDADGNISSITDRTGYVTTFTYTDYGNLQSITRHNGAGTADDEVTQYRYFQDSFGNDDKLQEIRNAEGNITSFTYAGAAGARGLPDTMTLPLGNVTTDDPVDYVTTYAYNAAGQVLTVDNRASAEQAITESFGYNERGWILTKTDANDETTTFTYDLLGRIKTRTMPDPDGTGGNPAPMISYVYDPMGNLLSSTFATASPQQVISYVYNSMNRPVRIVNADGTYRTWLYDQLGNVISETDALGHVTKNLYHELDRQDFTILADGRVAITEYDVDGRVVAVTDPLGNVTRFEYNTLGRARKRLIR